MCIDIWLGFVFTLLKTSITLLINSLTIVIICWRLEIDIQLLSKWIIHNSEVQCKYLYA